MKYIITDNSIIIIIDNYRSEFSKLNFNKEILNDPILEKISINELLTIWENLYGIPKNIKEILNKKIELYKDSFNVHSFYYNGKEYWLDKINRISLWNLSNSSLGNIEFVIGDEIITMNSIKFKAFLLKLEVYAYKCYVNTFKHLQNVKNLIKIEDILNYDYTTGYPEKITLE